MSENSTEIKPEGVHIPYFSLIRLRHSSGRYLASLDHKYDHANSSKQQIACCVDDPDDNTLWLVRPPDKKDYECISGDPVAEGNCVRLQHLSTGRNLHSHSFNAPLTTDQQEVSCYGEDGLGNQDDNWRISSRDTRGLKSLKAIRIHHVMTKTWLHSHGNKFLDIDGKRYQEVTAYQPDDANNDWEITEVLPPPSTFKLHPFFSIQIGEKTKSWNKGDDFREWVDQMNAQYSKVLNVDSGVHPQLASQVNHTLNELRQYISVLLVTTDYAQFYQRYQKVESYMKGIFTGNRLLLEDDARFQFIEMLRNSDPSTATHALAYFLQIPPENTTQSLKGYFSALCFEYGVSDRAKTEAKELAISKNKLQGELESLLSQATQFATSSNKNLDLAKERIQQNDKAFQDLLEKSKADFDGILKAFEQHMSLRSSVTYWGRKAKSHTKLAIGFGVAAFLVGGSVLALLLHEVQLLIPSKAAEHPEWWQLAVLLTIATFGIWGARILVQMFYSNVHLASDASERVTMMQTYLAMLKEEVGPKEDHKLLILQTLFRPAATGVVKDDGAPSTWLEIVTSRISGK